MVEMVSRFPERSINSVQQATLCFLIDGEKVLIHATDVERVGLIHFYVPQDPAKEGWNQDVHVFLVRKWTGKPVETEEMAPGWFNRTQLKYLPMWADDKYWLQRVLDGEMLEGWFSFDDNNEVLDHEIINVEEGGTVPGSR